MIFKKNLKKNLGFTIVEIIVVFSVIAILSSIGVAASVNYSRAQSLESAYQNLLTTLNQAKSYSVSQYKPDECKDKVLEKYIVELDVDNSVYTFSVNCESQYEISSASLPKDVSFSGTETTSRFFEFPILTGGIHADSLASSPWEIRLLGSDSRYKIITIYQDGRIK